MTNHLLPVLALTAAALGLTACQTSEPPPSAPPAPFPKVPEAPLTAEELFPEREIIDYTIQSGDSLWLIAENHKVPVSELRAANNIADDDNKIIAGKSLRVPLPAGTVTTTAAEVPPAGTAPVVPNVIAPTDDRGGITIPDNPSGNLPTPPSNPGLPGNADSGLPAPPPPPGGAN